MPCFEFLSIYFCFFVFKSSSSTLTEEQAPSSTLPSHSDFSFAEARPPFVQSAAPLTASAPELPDFFVQTLPAAAIIETDTVHAHTTISNDGPVAAALAAARESRVRRAAAVAAATAAAAASLASASEAKKPLSASIDVPSSTSVSTSSFSQSAQQTSKSSAAESVPASVIEWQQPVASAAVHSDLPMSYRTGSDEDGSTFAAAAPSGHADARSSTAGIAASQVAPAPDIASDGSSSTATADGIILWSHMEKDKKVHLNDFLANRYSLTVDVGLLSDVTQLLQVTAWS
jgi:hypothetical protein